MLKHRDQSMFILHLDLLYPEPVQGAALCLTLRTQDAKGFFLALY